MSQAPIPINRPSSPRQDIKRSAWYAGMPSGAAVPTPGSPAAWNMPPPVIQIEDCRGRLSPIPQTAPRPPSPVRTGSPTRSPAGRPASPTRNPFNFEPTFVSPSPVRPSQRRGHRYKHSSVSMNFFQEPEAKAPLAIPVSLAVPTLRECWQSMARDQSVRLGWCMIRLAVVLLLFTIDSGSIHSVAALAHWAAYDAVVATVVASVDVLSNFDVWKQSSLRLPFALQRTEVLAGFGLAVVLLFIGFDTCSHTIQDLSKAMYGGGHGHGHHAHAHHDVTEENLFPLVFRTVLTLLCTVVSLVPDGIGNAWTLNRISTVTLLFCVTVLTLPLLGPFVRKIIDELLTPVMACAMIYFGWQAAKQFGSMLVMSHDGPDNSQRIIQAISADSAVSSVSNLSIWEVHHDFWLASAKIFMTGSWQDEKRVREAASSIIRKEMTPELGSDIHWDTTIDISRVPTD